MGLGPLDAILGAVVVLLILLIRRRLAWVKSTARDIGVLGTTLAVIAITIFIGGALFAPSPDARPRFHLGGRCDISRDPCGSAPNGRPAACPAPALPARTGSGIRLSFLESLPARRGWRLLSMPRGSPMLPTSMRSSGPSPSQPLEVRLGSFLVCDRSRPRHRAGCRSPCPASCPPRGCRGSRRAGLRYPGPGPVPGRVRPPP